MTLSSSCPGPHGPQLSPPGCRGGTPAFRGCDGVLRWALMPRLGGITAHLPAMRRSQPGWVPGPERARAGQRPLGDTCGWPEHGCEKMLSCVRGQIVFRAAGGGIELGPADNMVMQGF